MPRIGFIKESSLKTNMTKTMGWSAKGTHLIDHTAFNHWIRQSLSRHSAMTGSMRLG